MLQVYGLVPILSARENVSVALRARGVAPAEADELAEAALARFHIADLGDRQVEELSGGQMQRVACARGFVVAPRVLLADEPTSELDEGNRGHVLAELRVEADRGAIVVVATHDPAVVAACDRHYALDEGRVVRAEAVAVPVVDEWAVPHPPRPTAPDPEPEPEPQPEPEPEPLPIADRPGRHASQRSPFARPARAGRAGRRRMIRAWRGAATRRGPLLTLAATTGVVVAGTVTVLGFAERADASPRLAAPLLLLGLVAIPDTGRELGSARREEIGVARLHGLQGLGLLRLVAVEPALAVAAGTLGGCAVGALGIRATTGRWLDEATWWVGWWPVLVAVAIAAVAVVAVLLGMARAVREPLADQVSLAERPRSASTAGVFGSLLVIVLAVVAGYRSHTASGQDPDWVVLVAPALVGLGAGQLAVWLLGAMGSVAVQAGRGQGLPTYLAVRRLRASAGIGHPLRLLVAAAVVAIVALAGAAQVSQWSDSTARLQVAGPVQVPFDGGAVAALQLTRTLDPEGRWLMAGAFVPGTGSGTDRRGYLDTARYPAVAGDFLAATPAAGLTPLLGSLRSDGAEAGSDVEIATGRRLVMEVAGSPRGPGPGLVVEVDYVNDEGFLTSAAVAAPAPPAGDPGAARVASTEVADCAHACVATTITVRVRGAGPTGSHLLVSRLDLGSTDLLSQPWVPSGSSGVTPTPAGLLVTDGRDGTLVPATAALPVVTTAGLAVPEAGTVKTPGVWSGRWTGSGTSRPCPWWRGSACSRTSRGHWRATPRPSRSRRSSSWRVPTPRPRRCGRWSTPVVESPSRWRSSGTGWSPRAGPRCPACMR